MSMKKKLDNNKKEYEKEKNNIKNEYQKKIEQINNEYYQVKKSKDNIQNQLNKEKENINNIQNELKRSKIRFTIRSKCALNKCLDSKSLEYGTSPHLWDYQYNNNNQLFELENNFDGTYSIKNSASGFYLGIDVDRIAFRKRNENSQSFYVRHYGDGFYLFEEKCGAVVDLGNYFTENGSKIGKFGKNGSNAQQWKLVAHI